MMTTNFTSLLETTFRRQYKFTFLNNQYILSNGKTNFTSLDNIIYPKCIRHILNIHCLCNICMIFYSQVNSVSVETEYLPGFIMIVYDCLVIGNLDRKKRGLRSH